MKSLNKLFLTIIIILTVSCNKQKMFKKINYSGIAYDNNTGNPLVDVKIELNACGGGSGDKAIYGCTGNQFNIGSVTTDSDGHFSFSAKAARSDIYYVYFIYNGMRYGAFSNGVSASKLNSEYSTIYLYH